MWIFEQMKYTTHFVYGIRFMRRKKKNKHDQIGSKSGNSTDEIDETYCEILRFTFNDFQLWAETKHEIELEFLILTAAFEFKQFLRLIVRRRKATAYSNHCTRTWKVTLFLYCTSQIELSWVKSYMICIYGMYGIQLYLVNHKFAHI